MPRLITPKEKDVLSIPEVFWKLTPEYKSKQIRPFEITFQWDPQYASAIYRINPKRADKRIRSYVSKDEVSRVVEKLAEGKDSVSIRFGVKKEGLGIHGTRGDFCLTSGVIVRGRDLTLFYRSIEFIGGLHFDLCIIKHLESVLGLKFRVIRIVSVEGHAFCLKRNSNEALYKKLEIIYETRG